MGGAGAAGATTESGASASSWVPGGSSWQLGRGTQQSSARICLSKAPGRALALASAPFAPQRRPHNCLFFDCFFKKYNFVNVP